ncbi:MAG: lysylphosphatidylglycerol synthase domain-containing protein [Pirellula sp.]
MDSTSEIGQPPGKTLSLQARIGRLKPLLKWLIVLVVAVFLYLTIRRAYHDVQAQSEHLDFSRIDWRWMVLGILFYAVGMIPAGIAWLQTLKAFGQGVPFWYGMYVYFLGHLGKYVPGKAMVIVLRAGKLHPLGVEIKPTIVSVFVETLTSICTGAVLGCAFLLIQKPLPPSWMIVGACLCIPCSLAFLLPHTFRGILAVLAKSKIGRMPKSVSNAFTWPMMIRTCSWMVVGWLMHGTAGWMVLSGIQSNNEVWTLAAWSVCVAAISLGAVVGFASMLPSGAVVRELIITWLLSNVVSQPIALFAAVAFRICNLIAEFLMIGILTIAKRYESANHPSKTK